MQKFAGMTSIFLRKFQICFKDNAFSGLISAGAEMFPSEAQQFNQIALRTAVLSLRNLFGSIKTLFAFICKKILRRVY